MAGVEGVSPAGSDYYSLEASNALAYFVAALIKLRPSNMAQFALNWTVPPPLTPIDIPTPEDAQWLANSGFHAVLRSIAPLLLAARSADPPACLRSLFLGAVAAIESSSAIPGAGTAPVPAQAPV